MLIYLAVILFCFLLAFFKMPRSIENIALVAIAFFLCFGYMTGTDWYNYELFYYDIELANKILKTREFGYFITQSFFSKIGVDFWTFHIVAKLLVFGAMIYFIRYFNVNVFLFLGIFLADIGFYLFIDCPFRNLIALGFGLIAFTYLFENKPINYFVLVFIAMTFHLSAIIMVFVYFIYKKNIKTIYVIIAATVLYVIAFNMDFLTEYIYKPLEELFPIIKERFTSYLKDEKFVSESINIGSFIRLAVLFILLLFKDIIVSDSEKSKYIFNIGIILLLIYPFGVSFKIFQRFPLFLFPFYVLAILYLLKTVKIKANLYILGAFFMLLSFFQTYNTVTADFRYVPYTNYIYYWSKKDFPPIEERAYYNKKHSPYKNKK